MKLTRQEKLLFAIPAALLALPLLQGQHSDLLDKKLQEIADARAIDCGIVSGRDNRDAANACVVAAYKAHKPFRVRYNYLNEPTPFSVGSLNVGTATALVGSSQGQVFFLYYNCASWNGFLYKQRVTCSKREVAIKQRNGRQVLGFASK